MKSIALYCQDVNMIYCLYEKETNNSTSQSTRLGCNCEDQGIVRLRIGYRGYSSCLASGIQTGAAPTIDTTVAISAGGGAMRDEQLYTSTEVMRFLHIKRTTFNRYLSLGQLRGRKVGQQWRFFAREVRAVVRRVTP